MATVKLAGVNADSAVRECRTHVDGARILRDVQVAVVGVRKCGDRPAVHSRWYQVPTRLRHQRMAWSPGQAA